jgi:PBP1b-binding outer membrane lipoprotein LpoB
MLKKILNLLIIVLLMVSCASSGKPNPNEYAELDNAISTAAADIMAKVPSSTKVALFNISRNESILTEYIIEELSVILVGKAKLIILDRKNLDVIREEHSFQLSGEVSDDEILSIARKSGATSVISCSITGEGDLMRLRVRALEIETGKVQSLTSHQIKKVSTVVNQQQSNNVYNQQYNDLQKFIETAEAKIKLTNGYVSKLEICMDVIDEIDTFLYESEDQKINDSVSKTRSVWDERANKFHEILERLKYKLTEKANNVSKAIYPEYNIENMEDIDFEEKSDSDGISIISITFYVKMRGNILGIKTQQFHLTVKGSINTRDEKIEVYEGYLVER